MPIKCTNTKCGHINADGNSYCVKCGNLLEDKSSKIVVSESYYRRLKNEYDDLQKELKELKKKGFAPDGYHLEKDKDLQTMLMESIRKSLSQSSTEKEMSRLRKRPNITLEEYNRLKRQANMKWYEKLWEDHEINFFIVSFFIIIVGVIWGSFWLFDNSGNTKDVYKIEQRDGLWGIVKGDDIVIPFEYDSISHRKGRDYQGVYMNFFYVYKNGRIGVADSTGKISINCELDATEGAYNGVIILQKDKKQGLMDCYGHQIIPCEYQYVLWQQKPDITFECPGTYVGNIIPVKLDNNAGWELYNRNGRKIRGQHYEMVMQTGDPRTIKVREKIKATNSSYYIYIYGSVDETGQELIPCKYYSMSRFSNDRAWVKENSNDSWTMITPKGEKVITLPKFYVPSIFSEGLAYVIENKKIGYCDVNGKFVIPMKYEKASDSYPFFYGGKAKVMYDGKPGYIDKTGKFTEE